MTDLWRAILREVDLSFQTSRRNVATASGKKLKEVSEDKSKSTGLLLQAIRGEGEVVMYVDLFQLPQGPRRMGAYPSCPYFSSSAWKWGASNSSKPSGY